MRSEAMKTSRSASTPAPSSADPEVASGEPQRGENAPAAGAAPPSGWMVLLRIFAYLVMLPAAILMLVRFLFQYAG
jgi:hypothetical protein